MGEEGDVMDFGHEYIAMCDCPEIQGHYLGIGDYYCELPDREVRIFEWSDHRARSGIQVREYGKAQAAKRYGTIWLPRQDQLQGMLDVAMLGKDDGWLMGCYLDLMRFFAMQLFDTYEPDLPPTKYYSQFTSMEQLWLAFVMREMHGRVWNGGEWVAEPVAEKVM